MIYMIEKDVYSLQDYFNTIEDTNVTLQDFIETVSKGPIINLAFHYHL